ncbi:G-type lectin S-receptor-like serine/threonine-protein kinase At1g67520 [Rutidosis leptorrhynchoides]|uniref:G-type lectin S-receptor-like serine/threonine-protein kinase At1g67520 n=1 Tax=Rutidosis leptorrhynchoides TaxID=125765 RepID=UPI003A98F2E6
MVNKSINLILILYFCYLSNNLCYSETDTLQQGQQLKDWDYLISSNKVFILKFYGPYLGIFYHINSLYRNLNPLLRLTYNPYVTYLPKKPLWVANRNNPVTDASKFTIDNNGKLIISSDKGTVHDLFSPSHVTGTTSVTLLDSGNLVHQELYPNGSVKRVLWQSFDYPTDTLLPGMKLGINYETGHKWSLTSWSSDEVAAPGSFTVTVDPNGTGQLVVLRHENVHWMSGPWQTDRFENTNNLVFSGEVRVNYISNETEQSFSYITKSYDLFPALRISQDGQLKGSVINFDVRCGSINDPGCVEYEFENLKCRKGYYFDSPYGYIYGDEYVYDEKYNLTLYDCKRICWYNCSCKAYTYANANRVGCKTYGKMMYNPLEAEKRIKAEKHREGEKRRDADYNAIWNYEVEKKKKKWIWLIIGVGSLAPLLSFYFLEKKIHIRVLREGRVAILTRFVVTVCWHNFWDFMESLTGVERDVDTHPPDHFLVTNHYNPTAPLEETHTTNPYGHRVCYLQVDMSMNHELHYFTFKSISSATNNFSSDNKLGEGGFGEVYKGILVDGQEIAAKRLSKNSEQGVTEFMNETELTAKLQHTNLVRILGCCIEKQEKILVYEYMPNNSLDFFLFDGRKKSLPEWNTRFAIINGIAQGLLYLHNFSRLRVIHRDLKASNILLDDNLNPKISDFGMAKLFGMNESETNTTRVVGTRGYMPPEYMLEGSVSTKTDIYSFSVLLIEIVSSKKNHGSYNMEHPLNLLGLAWELWNEGRCLELMDLVLEDSCSQNEVMRCIHVGLLCVQDHAKDRPSIANVILMLTNQSLELPEPKRPAFYIERNEAKTEGDDNYNNVGDGSVNGQSISILVAR